MEVPFIGESKMKQKEQSAKQKGGLVTMSFIIGIYTYMYQYSICLCSFVKLM